MTTEIQPQEEQPRRTTIERHREISLAYQEYNGKNQTIANTRPKVPRPERQICGI